MSTATRWQLGPDVGTHNRLSATAGAALPSREPDVHRAPPDAVSSAVTAPEDRTYAVSCHTTTAPGGFVVETFAVQAGWRSVTLAAVIVCSSGFEPVRLGPYPVCSQHPWAATSSSATSPARQRIPQRPMPVPLCPGENYAG